MSRWTLAFGVASLLALGVPASAHHSFAAVYLESDTVEIDGEVLEFQYKNPHSFIQIDATDAFGRRAVYAAEWGSVPALERQGISRGTLKVGDRVRVWGSPAKNPADNRIRLKKIKLPDGRTLGGQIRLPDRDDAPRPAER